jgi:hypothetical protein
MIEKRKTSRRSFVSTAAASAAALAIVPRHGLGRGFIPPSDTLNIAGIGIGGMGRTNLINLASQNIVALCDVDWDYAGKAFERLSADMKHLQARIDQPPAPDRPEQSLTGVNPAKAQRQLDNMKRLYTEHWPKATRYTDYREMLEKQKDIDAVVVATSDHMHAPRKARVRAEAADVVGWRSAAIGAARERDEGGHTDGKSRTFAR